MAPQPTNRRKTVSVIPRAGRAYSLRWRDAAGTPHERSARTRNRRAAERAAVALENELKLSDPSDQEQSWGTFALRYELEVLPSLSAASRGMWRTVLHHVNTHLAPARLSDLTAPAIRQWLHALSDSGLAPASVRTYWRTLRAALGWACDVELIPYVPRVRLGRGETRKARSRAVTPEEFALILAACRTVRRKDSQVWERFLRGLWESGLRVDELRRLSWDPGADLCLLPAGSHKYPLIRMLASGQKSRRDEWQPVTPGFWALVRNDPRAGWVFPLPNRNATGQISAKRAVRIVSEIGRASGVVTNPQTGQTATSHDIGRRAFLSRMDGVLSLPELQKWARHASPETTMTYYHSRSAEQLAAKVWGD